MRHIGLVASVVVLVMALGPMVVSADMLSPARYPALIDGDGLSGRVVVAVAADGESGHLTWSLEGLRAGRLLVITVRGGTCRHPGVLVVRHRRPASGSASMGRVALPAGSASAFLEHADGDMGRVTATVRSGQRRDCSPFKTFLGEDG